MPEGDKKKPVYFMMDAPGWFINLSDEEKMELAHKFAGNSDADQSVSEDDLADLLTVSTSASAK